MKCFQENSLCHEGRDIANMDKTCLQFSIRNSGQVTGRSSLPKVFYKKAVLKNFRKFTGKHLFK